MARQQNQYAQLNNFLDGDTSKLMGTEVTQKRTKMLQGGGIGTYNPGVNAQNIPGGVINSSSSQALANNSSSRPRSQLGHISSHL